MDTATSRQVVIRLFLPLGLALLVAGLYATSRANPFMLDDLTRIVNNPDVTEPGKAWGLWARGIDPGPTEHGVVYQPLTIWTYRINAAVTGLSPVAFRFVNAALLGFLGWLVAIWLNQKTRHHAGPWLAAFLFVTHPAHAETINHLIGRAELLAMIGVMMFLSIQHWLQRQANPRRGMKQLPTSAGSSATSWQLMIAGLGAMLAAALAMFSSTTGLIVLPLALAQAYFERPRRRPMPDDAKSTMAKPALKPRWMIVCIFFALGLPMGLWSIGFQAANQAAIAADTSAIPQVAVDITANPLLNTDLGERLPSSLSLAWFYARQALWPNPHFSHTPAQIPSWTSPGVYLGLGTILLVVTSMVVAGWKRRWSGICAALFISQYLIVGQLWVAAEVYASNLWTLPFTLAVVGYIASLIDRVTLDSTRRRAVAVIPCVLVGLAMAQRVHFINGKWLSKPRLTGWDLAYDASNPVSMYARGEALLEIGQYDHAQYWLDNAIEHRPESVQCRLSLGILHELRSNPDAATDHYQQILQQHPAHVKANLRLAILSLDQQQFDSAEHYLSQAQQVAPGNADVLYYLAHLAKRQGNAVTARERYRLLLARYPNHTDGNNELAQLEAQPTPGPSPSPTRLQTP